MALLGLLWAWRRREAAPVSDLAPITIVPASAATDLPVATPIGEASAMKTMIVREPMPQEGPAGSPAASAAPAVVPRSELPEDNDALELADVMVSMGLTQGAADALIEQIRANPRRALHHWLKLLDIYKASGNKEEFEKSATNLRHQFNIHANEWLAEGTGSGASLEDYGHVSEQMQKLWRQPGCIDFLANLLGDNRGGERAGFPQAVAEEILLLIAILRQDNDA